MTDLSVMVMVHQVPTMRAMDRTASSCMRLMARNRWMRRVFPSLAFPPSHLHLPPSLWLRTSEEEEAFTRLAAQSLRMVTRNTLGWTRLHYEATITIKYFTTKGRLCHFQSQFSEPRQRNRNEHIYVAFSASETKGRGRK